MLRTVIILLTLLTSCFRPPEFVDSYRAIYTPSDDTLIELREAQRIGPISRVYYHTNHVMLVESGAGIHVLDMSNPYDLKQVGFMYIPGCQEVELKNNTLYTKQFSDLLAIDIKLISHLKLERFKDVFDSEELLPPTGSYFECPDPAKGRLVGYELNDELIEYPCTR